MQVRYQAALRPEAEIITDVIATNAALATLPPQNIEKTFDFLAHRGQIRPAGGGRAADSGGLGYDFIKTVARAADGETLIVEQIADAPDQQHFVVLIIAAVAAALDRLELSEFLFPIAQYVRLDAA